MSNKLYFTPGPSQLFYSFNDHIKKGLSLDVPSLSHRSATFIDIVAHTKACLKELLELPDGYDIFFLSSANEAWDRIIQNLVIKSSHHFVNGAFSKKFYDFALLHQMNSTATTVDDGNRFTDFDIPKEAELIGITKNETSIGYSFSESEIEHLRNAYPDKLVALDVVSASPSLPVNFSNVDSAYFSVQKAFGMPAGLGVWICNQRCQEKAEMKLSKQSIGSYRSLPNLKKFNDKDQTPETPNMLFIYLLGKIAEDMLNMGKQRIINDTVYKSTILYQAINDHPLLTPFVDSAQHQSKTTIVAKTDEADRILAFYEKKGITLGTGYGKFKKNHIRIANFPTHSKESVEMIIDLLGQIE